jgi:hypothetical protein
MRLRREIAHLLEALGGIGAVEHEACASAP